MYYQKNYNDFIPRVSTKNYRYSKLWLEHTLKLNKILHFAPDFQPLILYYSLLASTFFSYTHYFSAKEPKAKNWARTGFLFQSQLSWGFLINECLLPLRERSYYYWTDCCCCWCFFPGHTTQFCLILFPLLLVSHYFTTKLGLDQKTQFGRKHKEKFEVSPWIWIILSDFMKIYKVVFFILLLNHFFLFGNDLLPKLLWKQRK